MAIALNLLDVSEFLEIISGRRRTLRAGLCRALFRVAEVPYSLAIHVRNRRYDRGKSQIHRVGVPVISVGNLTTGGTGKTPMVEWLARWFVDRDIRVSLISRGYGAEKGSVNDEALELEQRLPDVPHLQSPNRVEAATTAVEELDCELILLDDAFQHRRIHRDLDIVLIDALEPFGYGHLLPRGLLREPLASLHRANVMVLTRADMVSEDRRLEIRRQAQSYNQDACWLEVSHEPKSLVASSGKTESLEWLSEQRIAAFCGIGNPDGFFHTLQACGCDVTDLRRFPDHHRYQRDDIEQLTAWADSQDATALVCTCKDLVKIGVDSLGQHPLWAVHVGMEILAGQQELEDQLSATASELL